MFAELPRDQRKTRRAEPAANPVSGLVTDKADGARQPFLLQNISDSGVGLWTGVALSLNSVVKITLGSQYGGLSIDCEVLWTSGTVASGYQSGLKVLYRERKPLPFKARPR
jgi:hypothetical protein